MSAVRKVNEGKKDKKKTTQGIKTGAVEIKVTELSIMHKTGAHFKKGKHYTESLLKTARTSSSHVDYLLLFYLLIYFCNVTETHTAAYRDVMH